MDNYFSPKIPKLPLISFTGNLEGTLVKAKKYAYEYNGYKDTYELTLNVRNQKMMTRLLLAGVVAFACIGVLFFVFESTFILGGGALLIVGGIALAMNNSMFGEAFLTQKVTKPIPASVISYAVAMNDSMDILSGNAKFRIPVNPDTGEVDSELRDILSDRNVMATPNNVSVIAHIRNNETILNQQKEIRRLRVQNELLVSNLKAGVKESRKVVDVVSRRPPEELRQERQREVT